MCADFLTVTGTGITIMGGGASGPLCASDETVGTLEESQFATGEGPCPDAFRTGRSIHEPLLDVAAFGRWPTFASLATDHGIKAVFAYPLMSQGAKVGVLSLYSAEPGSLTPDQDADSLTAALVLTETVLSLQDDAPSGSLAVEIDDVVGYRAEIYQASGIAAIQLGITAGDALLRLRAHAFATEQPLDAVASAVVRGELRLDADAPGERPAS